MSAEQLLAPPPPARKDDDPMADLLGAMRGLSSRVDGIDGRTDPGREVRVRVCQRLCRGQLRRRARQCDQGGPGQCDAPRRRGPVGPMPDAALIRAPEGNGCAERFIRTLKENVLWVQTFDTVEDLRQAPLAFRNATWLIEQHGFITPAAFRQSQLQPAALAA
jgi:hypothetical protein